MMTKEIADALCTIITLGFAKDSATSSQFDYDKAADKEKYDQVATKFENLGVSITTGLSVPKETFPIIIAKTGRIYRTDPLVSNTETKLSNELERKVAALGLTGLYGAYIGGYSSISRIELVGASDLSLYSPTYRAPGGADTKTAYDSAVTTSNKVIDLLESYSTSIAGGKMVNGVKISIPYINDKVTQPYKTGEVFKSYHGMIVAMIKYSSSVDNNSFIFEIACSPTTSKVSSCFPCSTFMAAQKKPATSIHLGRGDNWNIPNSCSDIMRTTWRTSVITWYEKGRESLSPKIWDNYIATYASENTANKSIPDMFLEALTFESSFTDKIINTLK